MNTKSDLNIGANPGRFRSHNRQVVLNAIRASGEIGRAEIARASGLSIQAVSNIIAGLETDGMIRAKGRRTTGRGQPPLQYALNPAGGYAFGLDVRPGALLLSLVDLDGTVLFRHRQPIKRADPDNLRQTLQVIRERALNESKIDANALLGAGIVLPGPFGQTGLSGQQTELPGWQDITIKDWFADTLGIPSIVENDANAAALAERISGAAQGMDSYAFLYFGTGLGLGIVSRGQLMRGSQGNAGEIGHISIPGGGTLESHVSRFSLEQHMQSVGETITRGQDLVALYDARDPALFQWLEDATAPLRFAVQIVENLFDPEAIILGGAMPAPLLDEIIAKIRLDPLSLAERPNRQFPRLIRGASGQWTAARGAAALILNQVFTPKIASEH